MLIEFEIDLRCLLQCLYIVQTSLVQSSVQLLCRQMTLKITKSFAQLSLLQFKASLYSYILLKIFFILFLQVYLLLGLNLELM